MRVLRRYVGEEGKPLPGEVVHVTPQRARRLEDRGQAVPVAPPVPSYVGQWRGQTACVIAGGPSLTKADVEAAAARGWRMVGVNDAYRIAPALDMLYACDGKFWKHHVGDIPAELRARGYTRDVAAAAEYQLNHVRSENGRGLSLDPAAIHEGGNSGYQAINLAYHTGVARIVLLGFDMQKGKRGERHWFGDHPAGLNVESPYAVWIEKFAPLAFDLVMNGVEVLNASRRTALTCFPRVPLEAIAD